MEKINFNLFLKRAGAYLIDVVIVFVIGTIFSSIPLFNKHSDDYKNVYDSFSEVLNEYTNTIATLNSSFKDKEINQDEYDSLISFESYKDLFIASYDDNVISKDEYQEIVTEIDDIYMEKAETFEYEMAKTSISSTVITLFCMFGYFGVLQYLLNGQTIGKMILKLRVVMVKDMKISFIICGLRSLIVNNIFLNTVNILCLVPLNKEGYFKVGSAIDFVISVVEAVIIFFIITREDGRGLHDLICKTKVIIVDGKVENNNTKKKVIEGEGIEK